jgi:DNA-binding beta-propeller fold protein YncE
VVEQGVTGENKMKIQTSTMVTGVCLLFLASLLPVASVAAATATGTPTLQGTVAVGSSPAVAAFNPVNGLVYVTDAASNEVSLLTSGSTPKLVATLSTGSSPYGVTPTGPECDNVVAVSNSGSGSVSFYNSASPYKLVATVNIPSVVSTSSVSVPRGMAYVSGYIYVADGAGQIDIINCLSRVYYGSVALTSVSSLVSAFYDARHQIIYFADQGDSAIEYFDQSGNEPSCQVPTPCMIQNVEGNLTDAPAFFAENNNGTVFFTDSTANVIREISIVNGTPVIDAQQFGNFYSHEFSAPIGITFDPQNQELLVANSAGHYEITALCINKFSSFCKSAGVGGYQQLVDDSSHGFGVIFDPMNGYVYVTNHNSASVSYLS